MDIQLQDNNTTEEFTAPATFTKQVEGQLFFNSTANAFKETITDIPGATWSSGGNLNEGQNHFRVLEANTAANIAVILEVLQTNQLILQTLNNMMEQLDRS